MKSIVISIIISVLLFIIFYLLNADKISIREERQKNLALMHLYDSSQRVIDSLSEVVSSSNIVIKNLDAVSVVLMQQYKSKKSELEGAKKTTPATIVKVVKNYSIKQLDSSFAARYPKDTIKSDSVVTLQRVVGVKVLADLIYCDTLKKIVPLYAFNDSILNLQLKNRDSVIVTQEKSIRDYNLMIANYSNQRQILINQRNDSDKALKKSRTKIAITTIVGGAAIGLLIVKTLL